MEKKTAIVVINNNQFNSQRILAYNNVKRIEWFAQLVDCDCSIRNKELVQVFDTVEKFCNEYNCGCLRSERNILVAIEYTEKINGKFANPVSQSYLDKAIEQGHADVAEFISRISLCNSLDDIHDLVIKAHDMAFGTCSDIREDMLDINFKSVSVTVHERYDGGLVLGNVIEVYDGGTLLWTGVMDLTGADFVEMQDNANIYISRPADRIPTPPNEKNTPEKKYDEEFLDHIASIWRDGYRTILVDLSGEKYVINGLFDNYDVIIDCYVADTMQRIDRYFIVGAQEPFMDEAKWYSDYFVKKVVKDRNINDYWHLTDKQFKFLKEA